MKPKTKWFWALFFVLILSLSLAIPSYFWMKGNVKQARVTHNSRLSPVVFIPGSSATQDRFDSLIKMLNTGKTRHSLLKITVQTSGKLKISGRVNPKSRHPFVVVGFENNKDGYPNIQKQAAWFDQAMTYLQTHYQFNNFSGIGHSNGGLIYTQYLEHYFNSSDLKMNALMTIGTPYNFSETHIDNRTQMLADFIKNSNQLPKNLTMYSVAGTEDYNGDGIVPIQSVLAGKYVYQKQVKQYTEITVTGTQSGHSDLLQNKQIVRLIETYILNPTEHHPTEDK